MKQDPVRCDTCGQKYPRDPSHEVACPTCGAGVGFPCTVRRPSEHKHSATFAGLPPWGHDARDLTAAAEGKYLCACGLSPDAARHRLAAFLASGSKRWKPTKAEPQLALGGV